MDASVELFYIQLVHLLFETLTTSVQNGTLQKSQMFFIQFLWSQWQSRKLYIH